MKTFLRIISFARPLGFFVPQYILFTFLYIVFGLINFVALIPLMRVLFNTVDHEKMINTELPGAFEVSASWMEQTFNHYMGQVILSYGMLGALQFVCIIIISSVLLSNLFGYLAGVLLAKVRANVIQNIRNTVFEKITLLHLGFFTNERKGDITSKLTNDVQQIESTVVDTLKVLFRDPFQIIAQFAFLFYLSTSLTLYSLILLPISGALIANIVKKLKRKATEGQVSLGRITSIVDETLSGMRLIKAFTARPYVVKKFSKEIHSYATINISMARKTELASPVSEFFGAMAIAVVLLIGGSLILSDNSTLSAEEFITFIIVFGRVLQPAKSITKAVSNIQRGLASGERIFQLVDLEPEIKDDPNAVPLPPFSDSIKFNNVSFAYDTEPVLKDISFEVPKGGTVALVGPSGGGKSTLADLVPRFYDPSAGQVLIDGRDLRTVTIDSLRSQLGVVTQESILFNDSIFNNIAFGMEEASEYDVIKAAKIANAHDFIIKMEEGYQTNIGERGTKLSGGQRQRISIARAVMKNPAILILDEATSALDSESEKLVQEALTKLMANRTSIVIAHRLSTIQHADKILVIDKGTIVEAGNHDQLMLGGGVYRKLIELQNF